MGKAFSSEEKEESFHNIPINTSLSYTLNHLLTKVEIQEREGEDIWTPFNKEDEFYTELSLSSQKKFLKFFQYLKTVFGIVGSYTLSSGNNFPLSIGAASSASSFASLTLATYELAKDRSSKFVEMSREELAQCSRRGSGSSCRSFYSPWSLWTKDKVQAISFPFDSLIHQLIVIENKEKKIPSSEAHLLVKSSPYFSSRAQRAETRLKDLCSALSSKNWKECYSIAKEEFLDMHQLFETAEPAFSYQNKDSKKIVAAIDQLWEERQDGPLVTMDAGASVHLLYRPDQSSLAKELEQTFSSFSVFSSLK